MKADVLAGWGSPPIYSSSPLHLHALQLVFSEHLWYSGDKFNELVCKSIGKHVETCYDHLHGPSKYPALFSVHPLFSGPWIWYIPVGIKLCKILIRTACLHNWGSHWKRWLGTIRAMPWVFESWADRTHKETQSSAKLICICQTQHLDAKETRDEEFFCSFSEHNH